MDKECDFCQGFGHIEKTMTYRDDAGYLRTEGTGEFKRCFECNSEEFDDQELRNEANRLCIHND